MLHTVAATYCISFFSFFTRKKQTPSALIEGFNTTSRRKIMSLCSHHMPVNDNYIHSTQLLITVSEKQVLQKLNTISNVHISAIKSWPAGSTNKNMQVNNSMNHLSTIGLLTFSPVHKLTEPNHMNKQLLISQHDQFWYYSDILIWKLYSGSRVCDSLVFCGNH